MRTYQYRACHVCAGHMALLVPATRAMKARIPTPWDPLPAPSAHLAKRRSREPAPLQSVSASAEWFWTPAHRGAHRVSQARSRRLDKATAHNALRVHTRKTLHRRAPIAQLARFQGPLPPHRRSIVSSVLLAHFPANPGLSVSRSVCFVAKVSFLRKSMQLRLPPVPTVLPAHTQTPKAAQPARHAPQTLFHGTLA